MGYGFFRTGRSHDVNWRVIIKGEKIHPFIHSSIHPFIFTSIHPYIAFSRRDASLKGCRDEHRIPCKSFEQLTRSTTHLG